MPRIGVMTTGGDCAGLNAAIRAVVACCARHGAEVLGILKGTEGLLADPRLAPTTDAPLPLTAWRRFRFVLPVPKAVLPRVLRLWRDPDGARLLRRRRAPAAEPTLHSRHRATP